MAGYSATPLVRKLGIRSGERVVSLHAPAHYAKLLGALPDGAIITSRMPAGARFVHLFVSRRAALDHELPKLRDQLDEAGILWISWPKKSSGVTTDVTEDVIRKFALPLGLVDIKVCAVDDVWSGLKFAIRRHLRGKPVAVSKKKFVPKK